MEALLTQSAYKHGAHLGVVFDDEDAHGVHGFRSMEAIWACFKRRSAGSRRSGNVLSRTDRRDAHVLQSHVTPQLSPFTSKPYSLSTR